MFIAFGINYEHSQLLHGDAVSLECYCDKMSDQCDIVKVFEVTDELPQKLGFWLIELGLPMEQVDDTVRRAVEAARSKRQTSSLMGRLDALGDAMAAAIEKVGAR